MTPAIILDVLIAAILIGAVLRGCWRGLFLSLAGVAVMILALVGANMGAKALMPPLADWVTPKIEARIAETVENALTDREQQEGETLGELLPEELGALLDRMGLTEKLKEALERRAESGIAAIGQAVASAVTRALVESVLYAVLYILLFLALLAVLKLAVFSVSLILKLPVLGSINRLGGALLGLMQGAIVVWLLLWLLPRFGIVLPTEGTHLLHFFSTVGPLGLLSSLS